jgi:hypothetical protein
MARERCTAHRRDGERCGAPAIPYGAVCRRHGGSLPNVKAAAKRRKDAAEQRAALARVMVMVGYMRRETARFDEMARVR